MELIPPRQVNLNETLIPQNSKALIFGQNLKEPGPFFFHFFQSYCDFGTIRIVIFF